MLGVQSHEVMGWFDDEPVWVFGPAFDNVFVGRPSFHGISLALAKCYASAQKRNQKRLT